MGGAAGAASQGMVAELLFPDSAFITVLHVRENGHISQPLQHISNRMIHFHFKSDSERVITLRQIKIDTYTRA